MSTEATKEFESHLTEQHHHFETISMERRNWILLGRLAREYNVTEAQLASVMVEEEMEQIRQYGADKGALLCWLRNVKPVEPGTTLDLNEANYYLTHLEEAVNALHDYVIDLKNSDDITRTMVNYIFDLVRGMRKDAIPEQ